VPKPSKKITSMKPIGLSLFINKLNNQEKVIRNKTKLVAQNYNQQEGINFTEFFFHIAISKTIRLLLLLSFVRIKHILFFFSKKKHILFFITNYYIN